LSHPNSTPFSESFELLSVSKEIEIKKPSFMEDVLQTIDKLIQQIEEN